MTCDQLQSIVGLQRIALTKFYAGGNHPNDGCRCKPVLFNLYVKIRLSECLQIMEIQMKDSRMFSQIVAFLDRTPNHFLPS